MYVPEHFAEPDSQQLQALIRENGFGTLIVAGDSGIEANHLPFFLNSRDAPGLGTLECHLARNNPAWRQIEAGASTLAVFQGPHAYISPTWYPSKAETGRVVPTWNYLAVHVGGRARVIHEPEWLLAHLHNLTDHHESGRETPWSVADAPREFIQRLVDAIVGVEIEIGTLVGKRKASQNQSAKNRRGVVSGLNQEDTAGARAMAKLIR